MKVKTSVVLPADLLGSIDQIDSKCPDFARLERSKREAREIEIINRNADRLNAEACDVLEYQRLRSFRLVVSVGRRKRLPRGLQAMMSE